WGVSGVSALGRRPRETLHGHPASRRWARTRTARRLVVPERTAAGLGRQCQALRRDCRRRRTHPAPPAPLAARIERWYLPLAGRRSEVLSLLLLWGAAASQQAVLRPALCARRSAAGGVDTTRLEVAPAARHPRRR